MEKRWFVVSTEYERGWGSRVISVAEHNSKEKAELVAYAWNSKLTPSDQLPGGRVPYYYIVDRVSCDMELLYHRDYVDCRTKENEGG